MATIRKINSKWQVQIRRKGFKPTSKSFVRKADALEWARFKERQADRRDFLFDIHILEQMSWAELLERYRDNIVSKKKCKISETSHINAYLKREYKIASLELSNIKPYHFSEYRDQRLKEVKPATICRELGIFHHVFEIAKTEWGIPIAQNPLGVVKKPKINNKRERRLDWREYFSILKATKSCLNPYIKPIIQIAVHTGMRRGEILNLRWEHISFRQCTLYIPQSKNGYSRTIPMSARVVVIFKRLKSKEQGAIFPITANAFRLSWDRVLLRAGIKGLKFHDLRHEATSRFFERGLNIPEVALISGHRDYRMLARYTHLKAEDLVRKL